MLRTIQTQMWIGLTQSVSSRESLWNFHMGVQNFSKKTIMSSDISINNNTVCINTYLIFLN